MSELISNGSEGRYRLLRVALERFGCEPAALKPDQQQEAARIVGRQLQIEEVVLRSSEAVGVVIPESQVDDAWQSIRDRYENEEALELALESQGLESAQLRIFLLRDLKVEAVLDRICRDVSSVTDEEISQYYFSHIDQFRRPASYKARHILITINPDYQENKREAALSRMQAIHKRLTDKQQPTVDIERFAMQAMKHSECPTSMEGGLLGEVTKGKLYPVLENCLFDLEEGQLSQIVESPLGFHLIYCESKISEEIASLEEAAPRLRDWLESRQRQRRQREWLVSLLQQHASASLEKVAHG
ncbi:nitrogen fixation protein NifM [Azomonas macrocytogenes]|uniref:peptidylprolyl isomerase n=1 Tax=Azomonas macrocytogenes TaxID=69962 RepID=A0A839T4J3_AZOMA|nr:nitrogen fixation protein NifM [Azomonas macrocytogenes]MBB3103919.1 peptidyl-prolyl cis-trans isomerase C [Azomonas macrocytogenes]